MTGHWQAEPALLDAGHADPGMEIAVRNHRSVREKAASDDGRQVVDMGNVVDLRLCRRRRHDNRLCAKMEWAGAQGIDSSSLIPLTLVN